MGMAELMFIIGSILIFPALIFALVAQGRVQTTFNRYGQTPSSRGMTGAQLARKLLDENNCSHVKVVLSRHGHLSDHYDPRNRTVALSQEVHDLTSLAALGVAAHEVGHAIQHQNRYLPLMLRQIVIKSTSLINRALIPLILIGVIASIFVTTPMIFGLQAETFWFILIIAFCAMYGISFVINLITLPTEYNASGRAKSLLYNGGHIHDQAELDGISRVLNAAALTYVAALITSLAFLLRFLGLALMMLSRRR